jgi:hypothetical protein
MCVGRRSAATLRVRPEEGSGQHFLVKYRACWMGCRITHSTGLVLPIQPENVLSETSAGKEWKITSAEYGNDEVQEDNGGSKVEEVLSGKLRSRSHARREYCNLHFVGGMGAWRVY